MALSKVKAIAATVRPTMLNFNSYSEAAPYGPSHPNALSNGDGIGRGDFNGRIGTVDDINARTRQLAMNTYSAANPYEVTD